MRIFKWLFIAIIMLAILGFALQNQDQTVSVRIIKWVSADLPLYFFLYIAFGVGLILGIIIPAINLLQMNNEVRQTRKDSKRIREELNRLRNADIEEEKNQVEALPEHIESQSPEKTE
ncbi:LapA family protein [candidate division KSB1 bacterium]|nr:LapA family protein [candidate division KSB1 bacterium]